MNSKQFVKNLANLCSSASPLTEREIRAVFSLSRESARYYLSKLVRSGVISRRKLLDRKHKPYGYFVKAFSASPASAASESLPEAAKNASEAVVEPNTINTASEAAIEQEAALDGLESALRKIVNIRLRDERREWQNERAKLLTQIKKLETELENNKGRRLLGLF